MTAVAIRAQKFSLARAQSRTWSLVRVAVAILLLVAATLKLVTGKPAEPVLVNLVGNQWRIPSSILEFMLGCWLLSKFAGGGAWMITLIYFAILLGISIGFTRLDLPACGCFGAIPSTPKFLVGLDFAIVSGLLIVRPAAFRIALKRASRDLIWILVTLLFSLSGFMFVLSQSRAIPLTSLTVLRPDTWVSTRLPILSEIQTNPPYDLGEGRWILILYNENCGECQKVVPKAEHLLHLKNMTGRSLFVHVPIGSGPQETSLLAYKDTRQGKLTENKSWIVKTPYFVLVNNGIVEWASSNVDESIQMIVAAKI